MVFILCFLCLRLSVFFLMNWFDVFLQLPYPILRIFGTDDGICWLPEDPVAMAMRYRGEVRRPDSTS